MSDSMMSYVTPGKDPVVFLHAAIFMVDTDTINEAKVQSMLQKKLLDEDDKALLSAGIIGDDVFRVHSIQGQEHISNPFSFEVELHGNTDDTGAVGIDFDQLIGRPVSLGINLPSTTFNDNYTLAGHRFIQAISGNDQGGVSLFNGIVAGFTMKQPGVYSMTVKPALWKTSLTNQYRFYYQQNIKEMLVTLLKKHNIKHDVTGISGSDNPAITRVQDWLQAGESDYDLFQRLMGKAHIYYYFVHTGTEHTLVLANRPAYRDLFEDGRMLRYAFTEDPNVNQDDLIKDYSYQKNLMSSGVNTVFTTMENAWQANPASDFQCFEAHEPNQLGALPFQLYRVYQYGGSGIETEEYTDKVNDTLDTARGTLSGSCTYAGMRTGYVFGITNAGAKLDNQPVRGVLDGEHYVLTQVQHHATGDGGYQNQFQATESDGLVSAFNMQDTRQGSILAEVVHNNGSDSPAVNAWFGAKSDFEPELGQLQDQLAVSPVMTPPGGPQGVYVKLSSDGNNAKPFWVKLAPHMQQAPEVGTIVMIGRSSDDSELPEIQNVIQGNGNMTVTPTGWTTNTQVGSNDSTSYGDSKSIRYGKKSKDDLSNAIGIVNQAYQTGDFRDASYSMGGSYSYSTADKGKSGILSKSESFGSTYSEHTAAESVSYSTIDKSYSKQTMKETESYSTISGKSYSKSTIGETESDTTINGSSKSTSTIGSSQNTSTILGNSTSTSTILGNSTNTHSAPGVTTSTTTQNVVNSTSTTAVQNVTSATGSVTSMNVTGSQIGTNVTGSSINSSLVGMSMNASTAGMSVSSNMVGMQTSMSMTGLQSSTNMTGVVSSANLTGSSESTSLTGASVNTSITGASTNTSITGASVGTSIVGSTTDTNIVGSSTRMGVTGVSTSINVTGDATDISTIGSVTNVSMKGEANSVDIYGTGLEFSNKAAAVQAETVGTVAEIVSAIKMIL